MSWMPASAVTILVGPMAAVWALLMGRRMLDLLS
jgi:hypothetical protein